MRNHGFSIALLLVLSGCTGEAEPLPSDQVIELIDPTEGTQTPDPIANLIPARFHGTWDYVGGTCAPESDMRMEISNSEILFYESIGAVTAVTVEGQDAVLNLAMEGEGDTWDQRTRLSIIGSGDNERLAISDGDTPKIEDEYPRKRCPE